MKTIRLMLMVILLMLGIAITYSSAQDTLRQCVYFDYGKWDILPDAKLRLDSLAVLLQNRNLESLRITGNTDKHGSHGYNRTLSESRSRAVYDYLADKGLNVANLEILSQGKSLPISPGDDESSRALNRRVDIIAILSSFDSMNSVVSNEFPERINGSSEKWLEYSDGVRLYVPEGTFSPYDNGKINIKVDYSVNMDNLAKAGFTTMTSAGEVLASSGVFSLKATFINGQSLPDSLRLVRDIEVYIPVTKCACLPQAVSLWQPVENQDNNIVWGSLTNRVRIVKEGTRQYYAFTMNTLSSVNLDCPQRTIPVSIAFRQYDPVSVKLVYPMAKSIIVGEVIKPGLMRVQLLKTGESPKIYAVARNEKGEEFQISGKRLKSFSKNFFNRRIILRKEDFKKATVLKLKKVDKDKVTFGFVEPK